MELNALINELSMIHNGSFSRISYQTELPVKAKFKNLGFRIIKHTSSTARYGVSYSVLAEKYLVNNNGNLKSKKNNKEYIIPKKIFKNIDNNKIYLCIYPIMHGSNSKSTYDIYLGKDIVYNNCNKEEVEKFVIDSYWKPSTQRKLMYTVSIENVISVR